MRQTVSPLYAAPVHRGLAVAPRRKTREADHPRRGPERARSALGLPLPPALPVCHAAMRGRGPGPQRGRLAAHGGLPPILSGGPMGRKARRLFGAAPLTPPALPLREKDRLHRLGPRFRILLPPAVSLVQTSLPRSGR